AGRHSVHGDPQRLFVAQHDVSLGPPIEDDLAAHTDPGEGDRAIPLLEEELERGLVLAYLQDIARETLRGGGEESLNAGIVQDRLIVERLVPEGDLVEGYCGLTLRTVYHVIQIAIHLDGGGEGVSLLLGHRIRGIEDEL